MNRRQGVFVIVPYGVPFLFCLITDKRNEATTNKNIIATQGYIFKKIALWLPKKRE